MAKANSAYGSRRKVAAAAGVRPKSPNAKSDARVARRARRGEPKTVREADEMLESLDPGGLAVWDQRKKLLNRRAELGRRSDNEATRLRGTVEVSVDDPDDTRKARRNLTRVRQSEAWRHNRLSGMQRDAEKEMEFAWRQRTAGLGAAVSKYGLQRGSSTRGDLGSSLDASWCEWATLAVGRRIMIAAVIDCLAEPKTLCQIERDHRMRRGQAFDNYVLALDLWCEVRGWIRGPRMDGGPTLAPEGVSR